ncbi:MAG TPA: sigma-E factor negative regulatory protein, partial [Methylibium sp.]
MFDPSDSRSAPMEELSAMVDGELDPAASARIATGWRDDGQVRAAWHAYHLIGDVLRSEDLACAGRNEAFLRRVRARLAEEPVVLAPA